MTVKELLKMIRSDLRKWNRTRDGKNYKNFFNQNREVKR